MLSFLYCSVLHAFCRLLDILADRKSNRYVSGIVLLNGQMLPKNYKCASGYVVQVSLYGIVYVYVVYIIQKSVVL